MCEGNFRIGNVCDVLRGPFAVVTYELLPIEVIKCVATLVFDKQKKHSDGFGGILWRFLPLCRGPPSPLPKRVNVWDSAAGALRFLVVNASGDAVVPAGIVVGGMAEESREKA